MAASISMARTRALCAAPKGIAPSEFFRALCLDVAGDLDVDQVSVWTFEHDQSQINCLCAYDALSQHFSSGQSLKRSSCPLYFEQIVEQNIVAADDVTQNSATKEFLDSYFKPHGIKSLLDFIMHQDMEPYGIICCENRRAVRKWRDTDRSYLRSIAALTSFLFLPTARKTTD
jgi:GAF domain-containing protein